MSEIFQAVETFGILPVLIIILVVILCRILKTQSSMNEKQQEINEQGQKNNNDKEDKLIQLIEENTKMYSKLEVKIDSIEQNTNTTHSKQEEEINHKVQLNILNYLQKLQNSTNANRVAYFSYHNGGKDITGRSFQKMSMTAERVDSNTASIMSLNQNIQRTMYPILFEKLSLEGHYYIDDMENIKPLDAITYQYFNTHDVKSAYVEAVKDNEGKVLGFLTIEYSTHICGDKKKMLRCLRDKSLKISGALVSTEVELTGKEAI